MRLTIWSTARGATPRPRNASPTRSSRWLRTTHLASPRQSWVAMSSVRMILSVFSTWRAVYVAVMIFFFHLLFLIYMYAYFVIISFVSIGYFIILSFSLFTSRSCHFFFSLFICHFFPWFLTWAFFSLEHFPRQHRPQSAVLFAPCARLRPVRHPCARVVHVWQRSPSGCDLFSFFFFFGFPQPFNITTLTMMYRCCCSHSGGGVMGAAGRNAAFKVLQDLKRWLIWLKKVFFIFIFPKKKIVWKINDLMTLFVFLCKKKIAFFKHVLLKPKKQQKHTHKKAKLTFWSSQLKKRKTKNSTTNNNIQKE